ncbi:MAG TPA: hypothetical protein VF252_11345 [Gemmatimonadales bacterium]
MSICDWLSDRMPSVALGETEWTPEEARHLGDCAPCNAEWRLLQTASRLGSAARLVPDPHATARAVLLRLGRPEPRFSARSWVFSALAAASIAAVMWVGGRGAAGNPGSEGTPVAAGLPMPLPELDALQPAELDSVLTTMDDSSSSPVPGDDVGLGDLDSEELQQVLDTWEG